MPISSWGWSVSAQDAPGRTPSAASPPVIAIPPASAAEAGGPARAGDPARRESGHGDRRDRRRRRDRRHAPALREEDDEQEEGAGQSGRQEREPDLGPEVEIGGGPGLGRCGPRHRRDGDHEQQRNLQIEDRLPVEDLGEDAAERRPDRDADRRRRAPGRRRQLVGAAQPWPATRSRRRRRALLRRPGRRGRRSVRRAIPTRRRRRTRPTKIARPAVQPDRG